MLPSMSFRSLLLSVLKYFNPPLFHSLPIPRFLHHHLSTTRPSLIQGLDLDNFASFKCFSQHQCCFVPPAVLPPLSFFSFLLFLYHLYIRLGFLLALEFFFFNTTNTLFPLRN
jgi:hypothetical protein